MRCARRLLSFVSWWPMAYPADAMKVAGVIRIATRAWVLLLTILVVLCATGLAGAAMVMADGQDCAGPFCEVQIGCGQPTQRQNSPGYTIHPVATPATGERLLPPARIGTRSVDLPLATVSWPILGPPASRAPPAL